MPALLVWVAIAACAATVAAPARLTLAEAPRPIAGLALSLVAVSISLLSHPADTGGLLGELGVTGSVVGVALGTPAGAAGVVALWQLVAPRVRRGAGACQPAGPSGGASPGLPRAAAGGVRSAAREGDR